MECWIPIWLAHEQRELIKETEVMGLDESFARADFKLILSITCVIFLPPQTRKNWKPFVLAFPSLWIEIAETRKAFIYTQQLLIDVMSSWQL